MENKHKVLIITFSIALLIIIILLGDDYREDKICHEQMTDEKLTVFQYFTDKTYDYQSTLINKQDDEFLHLCCDKQTLSCYDITENITTSYDLIELDGRIEVKNVVD